MIKLFPRVAFVCLKTEHEHEDEHEPITEKIEPNECTKTTIPENQFATYLF